MFEVAEKDLVGKLTGFPIEVVRVMILRQTDQGNLPNVQKFQSEPRTAVNGGGFDWDSSVEGFEFWSKVIALKQWDVFFEHYPRGIEIPSIKKPKTVKAPRKMHFTKAQKWCLERIRLNTGTIHDRLRAMLDGRLHATPHFDFPILTSEIDEALKLFCLDEYDSAPLEDKRSALRVRINEVLTSIYYMNQAFMGDDVGYTVRICDKKSKGVRSALNWAKKHYALLDKLSRIRFANRSAYSTAMDVMGKVSGISSSYKYNKAIGAYSSTEHPDNYILGNILLRIH